MKRVATLGVIWGWSFLFIKVAVAGFPPATLTLARILLGLAVLGIAVRVRGERLPSGIVEWRRLTLFAVFSCAVPFTLFGWGEQRVASAVAGVMNGSTVLFTALVGLAWGGAASERLTRRVVLGLAMGFVGVGVASGIGGSDLGDGWDGLLGAGACLVASACYGVAFVYARQRLGSMTPMTAAMGQLVAAAVLTAPLGILTAIAEGVHPTPTRVGSIFVLGVAGTGLAFLLNQQAIAEVGATRASMSTYIIPIVALTVGIVVLDEPFRWSLLLGGALVVGGMSLTRSPPVTETVCAPEGVASEVGP